MLGRKIRRLIRPSILLVLLFLSLILLSNSLIQRPAVQEALLDRLSAATGLEIRAQEMVLNLWRGVGVFVYGLEAKSRHGTEGIVASKVRVILDATQLLKGDIVPVRLYLIQPDLELTLPADIAPSSPGQGPPGKGRALFWIPGLKSISIDSGRVHFRDSPLDLRNLFLDARQPGPDPGRVMLQGQGDVRYKGKDVPFRISGPISRAPDIQGLPSVKLALETGRVPLNWIPWPRSFPVTGGTVETRLRVEGDLERPLSLDGKISIHSPQFAILSGERRKGYALPSISLDFESSMDKHRVAVPSLTLRTKEMTLSIAFDLDLKDRGNPSLKLRAEGPHMGLDTFKGFFPTPLLPPWVETRLFPILQTGEVELKNLSLTGRVEQIRHLERPENASVFTMRLGCRHLEVAGQGIELPFREVSANVVLEKGDLRISGLSAAFGTSRIKGSGLNILEVTGQNPVFEALVDGSFDLQDLMRQKGMDIIPPDALRKLKHLGPLSGQLDCRTTIRYRQGWDLPRTEKGEFVFEEVLVKQKDLRFPLYLRKAQCMVDAAGENRFVVEGAWGDSPFQANGIFGKAEEKFPLRWANVSADMNMNEVISLLYRGEHFPLTFGNPLPCQLYVTGAGDKWSCQGSIDLEGVSLETNRFVMAPPGKADKIFFDLDFSPPGRLVLREILGEFGESSFKVNGSYNLKSEEEFSFDIFAPSLSMEELGIRFYNGGRPAKGFLGCQLRLRAFPRQPLETTVTGMMEGKDLFLDLDRLPFPIQGCSFKWNFSGKQVSIPFWNMRVGRTPLLVQGELEGWDGVTGTMSVNADFVDSADLFANGGDTPPAQGSRGFERFTGKSHVRLSLNILQGLWKGLKVGPLTGEMDLMGRDIYLRHLKAHMDRGLIEVTGRINSRNKPEINLSGHIQFTDQTLRTLLEGLGLDNEYLEGKLTMEARLRIKGGKREELVSGMFGNANILVKEGTVKKSHLLLSILNFLSVQKIFKKRPPQLSTEGFYFQSMGGHFEIDRGVLSTNNAIIRSPVLNAVASGRVDLAQGTVSLNLGVQPLETVDALVSNIPVLGHILTGNDKKLLTYYFTAKGPLKRPQVHYVPFKNLGSDVGGILKRLFLSPVKLFRELSRLAASGQEEGAFRHEDEFENGRH